MSEPSYKIKDWAEFQHYKDRRPPWIKLHHSLLDDAEYAKLPAISAKCLVLLWLIASESEKGTLPPPPSLAFRLRMSERDVTKVLHSLIHFIQPLTTVAAQDASATLATCYTETETETEEEVETETDFDRFWNEYPRKVGKEKARQSWRTTAKIRPTIEKVIAAVQRAISSDQWLKDNGQFIPHPSTWLNQGRWDDQPMTVVSQPKPETDRFGKPVYDSGADARAEAAVDAAMNRELRKMGLDPI